ncbi:MAG TPA: hypothetical protein VMR80_07935 [Candidatus Acidoferrum sp.]|nr:hypothetical protein [Candidatus Acidoferrum sp.]
MVRLTRICPTVTYQTPSNEQVQAEISTFLEALLSYEQRFAKEPEVSFEEHFCSLVPAKKKGAAAD